MTADPRQACVARFRREYGRLCHLAAEALAAGARREAIYHAMRAEGVAPQYEHIRKQRREVDLAYRAGERTGVAKQAMAAAGMEPLRAVEAEFGMRLPLYKAD